MSLRRTTKTRRWTFPLAAALSVTSAAGCIESKVGPDDQNPEQTVQSIDWTRAAALTAADSCEQAEGWLEEAAIVQMDLQLENNRRCFLDSNDCMWYRGGMEEDMATDGPPTAPTNGAPGQDDQTPDEYSETNTQVEGVDEADRVKTDGTHVYTLSNNELVVVKSWPAAETAALGRVAIRGYAQSFFLDGDRAIVLGQTNLYDVSSDAPPQDDGRQYPGVPVSTDAEPSRGEGSDGNQSSDAGAPSEGAAEDESKAPAEDGFAQEEPSEYRGYRQVSMVTIIDLSDKANPRVIKEHFFDGYALDTRRIDDKVYLAQNSYVYFDNLQYWPEFTYDAQNMPDAATVNAAFDAMRAANVAKIRARTLDQWLPKAWTATNGADVPYASGASVSGCTDVHVPSVFSGQSLLTLVTLDTDDGAVAGSTIQGNWGTVYASQEALYIGTTNWDFYWWWQNDADAAPSIQTHIHKFAYDVDGNARYSASGEVLGYAINQFAFDEFEGNLRVATTDGFGWWNNEESESRVTVLRQNGRHLDEQGVVAGLGLGETIHGVRFIGDQGYVVTFRQVDPLYVIDLSDATNPTVAGELKIPGFSSYIHPLGDGFLLTAGRDGDEEGNLGGVKIEIFNVQDPANPFSVKTAVIGDGWNTWSDVLWDHKAFNYFPARNLLAIPVSGWQESETANGWYGTYKSELALFRVTTSDIEVLPTISHMGFFDDFGGNDSCRGYGGYWQASIFRGVFVEDYVYSFSELGLQVHDTRDLTAGSVAEVTLLEPQSFPYYDWNYCDGGRVDDGGEVPPDEGGDPDRADPTDPADGAETPAP